MRHGRLGVPRRALLESLESRRLLSAGGLDATFGHAGSASAAFSSAKARSNAMAVGTDGKIVEVGTNADNLAVVRYNADGSLDTTFGDSHSGKLVLHYFNSTDREVGLAVAVQS